MSSRSPLTRTLLTAAGLSVALACAATGPASAQDDAAAAFEACSAAHCFAVAVTPELAASLADDDGATIEEVAAGLTFRYRGEDALRLRLVAARYDRGRLVRYGVSPRTEPLSAGDALAIPGAAEAIDKAFRPVTEPGVTLRDMESDGGATTHEVGITSYVGETPLTYLIGAPGAGMIDLGAEDARETPYGSSVGVIAILPEDDELRAEEASGTVGAVVKLDLHTR